MENIKTIYVHLSPDKLPFAGELTYSNFAFNEVPDYTHTSIEQTKNITKSDCVLLALGELEQFNDDLNEFFKLCKEGFPSFYKDSFWLLTLLRLYVVYLYVVKFNVQSFVHLENDNLIYHNYDCLKKLPEGCYFTKVGPYCGSAGFVFCNNVEKFTTTINSIKTLLKKGENAIKPLVKYSHLSEMIMIDLLVKGGKAEYLPLIPTDKYFDFTDYVFDGASYGQYIGGTNNNNGPGWYGLNHYIGQLLSEDKIKIKFENKTPSVIMNNNETKIFNLHIHSKELKKYV